MKFREVKIRRGSSKGILYNVEMFTVEMEMVAGSHNFQLLGFVTVHQDNEGHITMDMEPREEALGGFRIEKKRARRTKSGARLSGIRLTNKSAPQRGTCQVCGRAIRLMGDGWSHLRSFTPTDGIPSHTAQLKE